MRASRSIVSIVSIVPAILAIPLVFIVVLALPMTQRFFLPPPQTITDLIELSHAKEQPREPVRHDVEYDRDLLRRYYLDVYGPLSPEGAPERTDVAAFRAAAPVVVFFHGGSWLRGDKVTILVIDRFLRRMREAGWFVVSVNYTTSILRGIGGPVEQAREAVRWVHANAATYGWDPRRIGLYGVSAGGHVALLAAETPFPAMEGTDLAFVFAECAPTDLIGMRDGDGFENAGTFRFFPEARLRELSPITYVSADTPPVLLFHGDRDQTVHVNQSRRYAVALENAGGEAELVVWPGGDHAFLNLPDSEWYIQETVALDWMASYFAR